MSASVPGSHNRLGAGKSDTVAFHVTNPLTDLNPSLMSAMVSVPVSWKLNDKHYVTSITIFRVRRTLHLSDDHMKCAVSGRSFAMDITELG